MSACIKITKTRGKRTPPRFVKVYIVVRYFEDGTSIIAKVFPCLNMARIYVNRNKNSISSLHILKKSVVGLQWRKFNAV